MARPKSRILILPSDVTRTFANDRQLDDDLGVVVTTLSAGYPAQKADLAPGDVIRAINGTPATDLETFMKLYEASTGKKETRVLLEVSRGLVKTEDKKLIVIPVGDVEELSNGASSKTI